jgi:STE24 endopeptidase
VCYAAHVAWTVAAPLLLSAFGGLRPLRRPSLAARLDALIGRAGVDLAVREWRGGDETSQAHAALAGLGRTRQILLSDTLVDTLRDDEIEVVVAHEIGHHVHGDVWRAAAWRLAALPLTVGLSALILARLGAPWGAWPLAAARGPAALAAALPWLPILAAAALAVHRALEPIGLALSRGRELRADAYAVRLTGGADAFVTSMRRLSQTNLVDEQPPRLAQLLSSHPPVRERVLAAIRLGAGPLDS